MFETLDYEEVAFFKVVEEDGEEDGCHSNLLLFFIFISPFIFDNYFHNLIFTSLFCQPLFIT